MTELADISTSGLLAEALRQSQLDADSDERWKIVYALHKRASQKIFDQAASWCRSAESVERQLGADILAQLGGLVIVQKDPPFASRSIELMRRLLTDEEPNVIEAAVIALARLDAANVLTAYSSLANHPSRDVRWAVAFALGFAEGPEGTGLLMALMEDDEADIRDWATFGIGSMGDMGEKDNPKIRESLFRRIEDPDEDTQSEAVFGLAKRKDVRSIPYIRDKLISEDPSARAVEAARDIGAPVLLRALIELRPWWDLDRELLEEAIKSCGGANAER